MARKPPRRSKAGLGAAGQGRSRHGKARQGEARPGKAWQGRARQGCFVEAVSGPVPVRVLIGCPPRTRPIRTSRL